MKNVILMVLMLIVGALLAPKMAHAERWHAPKSGLYSCSNGSVQGCKWYTLDEARAVKTMIYLCAKGGSCKAYPSKRIRAIKEPRLKEVQIRFNEIQDRKSGRSSFNGESDWYLWLCAAHSESRLCTDDYKVTCAMSYAEDSWQISSMLYRELLRYLKQ